jgi:hypothetical protein
MNPELISLISSSLGYLAALVAQGAVSRIGEGFTESIAELLHEVATGDRKAKRRLATFEDEPDDDSNRERLAQQLAEQIAGNTAAIARLAELLAEVQAAYPQIINTASNLGAQGVFHGDVQTGGTHYEAQIQVFLEAAGVQEPPQDRHILRPPADPQVAVILAEDHIQHPMERVFHFSMRPYRLPQHLCSSVQSRTVSPAPHNVILRRVPSKWTKVTVHIWGGFCPTPLVG